MHGQSRLRLLVKRVLRLSMPAFSHLEVENKVVDQLKVTS